MGYVFTYNDARHYEHWLNNPSIKNAVDMENWLMLKMLMPSKGETALDIGCGIGSTLVSLQKKGLYTTGIDASPYMLEIASKKIKHHADLHRCFAEELPFDDNTFNYSCIINTLEFVEEPCQVLEEAFRVTKDRVFIGILNRYSCKVSKLRLKRIFIKNIYKEANFFNIWELKRMIYSIIGNVPVSWRTVNHIYSPRIKFFPRFNPLKFSYKYPFGAFTGISVVLMPRFKTRPLKLKCPANQSSGTVTGLASTKTEAK